MKAVTTGALVLGVILGLAGCGGSSMAEPEPASSSPDYFYEVVRSASPAGRSITLGPDRLVEALPNHTLEIRHRGGTLPEIYSVIVAAGTITSVDPGDGIAHDPVVDEAFEVVAFDDPSADERNIVVTMDVSESAGEAVAGESLVFRMGVIGGADPQRFLESVRGLKDVVVVLDRLRDGRSKGDLVPAVGPLLGPLATDGSFSLPALGEDEAAFVGELDTVGELLEAASGPAWVSRKTLEVHSK